VGAYAARQHFHDHKIGVLCVLKLKGGLLS
jgi:hypothetical protein